MELTYRRIAKNLSLSLGTVHNVYRHFKETGEVAPAKADYQDRVLRTNCCWTAARESRLGSWRGLWCGC